MNWNRPLLAVAALATLSLVSCEGVRSGSDGMTIYYPTVSDMERYEAQWGMQPKAAPAHTPAPQPAGAYVPDAAPPAPAPVPAPPETVQPAVPATPPATVPPSLR